MKLSTVNPSPLYEQVRDYENLTVRNTPAILQQPLPPQPPHECQLTVCPAYVLSNSGSGGAIGEDNGEYDIPRDRTDVARRNEGQYENVAGSNAAATTKGSEE